MTSLDYTSRDFDGLKQSLLDYASVTFPDWQPSSEGDFGVLMVELLAYTGDVLSYYVDRAQLEAYLPTATQRASVLALAQLLGYTPSNGTPATATVTLQTAISGPAVDVPAGTLLSTDFVSALDQPIYFETTADAPVPAGSDTAGGTFTVGVIEGETKKDAVTGGPLSIGTSSGLANQQFRLPHPKVYTDTIQVYVNGVEWVAIDHLLDAASTEERFEVTTDDAGYTYINFGDGLNGVIPNIGLAITATYRVGVGAAGNVPAGAIIAVADSLANVSVQMSTINTSTSTAASGGSDPESQDQIRVNAPRAFATQQRAVTLNDYENFALAVPGVSKANAVAGSYSSVSVYIVGADGNAPDQTLKDRTTLALNDKTLAGVTVQVLTPTFPAIDIGTQTYPVAIVVWPTYSRTQVQFAVHTAISNFMSFANRDLGEKLTVGQLYNEILGIAGVRYISIPLFARQGSTGTADIQLLASEFPTAGNIVVQSTGGIG